MTTGVVLHTGDVAGTRAVGRRLAALLRAGDLVVLTGPLGAGKTVLAQGIGDGLAVAGNVTSPTFVLAREHRPDPARGGRLALVHVDAYRLRGPDGAAPGPDALEDLDLATALEAAVVVVEWGEGLGDVLADAHLSVGLDRPEGAGDADEAGRTVRVTGHGARWAGVDLAATLT